MTRPEQHPHATGPARLVTIAAGMVLVVFGTVLGAHEIRRFTRTSYSYDELASNLPVYAVFMWLAFLTIRSGVQVIQGDRRGWRRGIIAGTAAAAFFVVSLLLSLFRDASGPGRLFTLAVTMIGAFPVAALLWTRPRSDGGPDATSGLAGVGPKAQASDTLAEAETEPEDPSGDDPLHVKVLGTARRHPIIALTCGLALAWGIGAMQNQTIGHPGAELLVTAPHDPSVGSGVVAFPGRTTAVAYLPAGTKSSSTASRRSVAADSPSLAWPAGLTAAATSTH